MLENTGFITVDAMDAKRIIADCERDGWRIFRMPAYISSKDEFFDAVRRTLPLDPMLQSNKSWDALADSLWGGLESLDEDEILIIWPDLETMGANSPEDYLVAKNILKDLPGSLADTELTANKAKKLLIAVVN